MRVNRKTRNIAKYLSDFTAGATFMLGLELDDEVVSRADKLGFNNPLVDGERLLPVGTFGPASRRNANGFYIIHRDQPKETAYRQIEWHWTEFRGRDDYEEKSKVIDVPYKRYPRTYVDPYSIELQVMSRADGKRFIVAGPFIKADQVLHIATNTANVLRETLGGFEVLEEGLTGWNAVNVRRLNWKMLPSGKNPFESAKEALEQIVERAPAGNQSVLKARLDAVGSKKPDFVAIGLGGFDGYTAFGFSEKKLCVLESPQVNNATYILPLETWEAISMMTKAEIINNNAHTGRLIHNRLWFSALDALFERNL